MRGDGHSSGTAFADGLKQPTRMTGSEDRPPRLATQAPSLFGLAPGGACPARPIAGAAVRSYRTFSPLPSSEGGLFSAALSLKFFIAEQPGRALPGALSPWSPDFPLN